MKRIAFSYLLLIIIVIAPVLLNGQSIDAVTYFNPNNKEHKLTLFIVNERKLEFSMSFGANSGADAISAGFYLNAEQDENNKMSYSSDGIQLSKQDTSGILCHFMLIIDTTDFTRIRIDPFIGNEGNYKQFFNKSFTMLLDSTSNFLCLGKLKQKTIFLHHLNQVHEVIKDGKIFKYKITQEYLDELHFDFECRSIKTNKLIKRLKGIAQSSDYGYEEIEIPIYNKFGDSESGLDYYEASGATCYDWEDGKGRIISLKFDPSYYYLLVTEYHEKNKKFKSFWSTKEVIS